ncbi:MAG: type III-B CRISPR module-associated Cmr3 family protein [Sulfuricellaceae bacterium]
MSAVNTLRLSAFDTLFFRESRPFDAIGGSELASVFPPPPRTVLGAVRTAIGDALGADWKCFGQKRENYALPDGRKLYDLIGYGDDLASLSLAGVWLSLNGERLYPAPWFLLQREDKADFARLRIGAAVRTHGGNVRLPQAPGREYRALSGAWLTRAGLEKVLQGGVPESGELHRQADLYATEPRLGIARDNGARTVLNGLLYQSRHIRPKKGLSIEADICGLEGTGIENRIVRLGSEGRLADIAFTATPDRPAMPAAGADTLGVMLVLLTPARFGAGATGWLPPGFAPEPVNLNGADVWRGAIDGIALTLHAAVLGKVLREGGWDMAGRKPRAVQSLIPPGSSYYCTVDNGDIAAAIAALHGRQLGDDREWGRGAIACGLWKRNEFFTDHPGENA